MEIHCPSRLHFGLLAVPGRDEGGLEAAERPLRSFGGAGLMIESPGFRIACEPADSWSTDGPEAEVRAAGFVEAYRSARGRRRTHLGACRFLPRRRDMRDWDQGRSWVLPLRAFWPEQGE